jgi:threonine dehydrogenase-like Zn-dependent dehydrogenase
MDRIAPKLDLASRISGIASTLPADDAALERAKGLTGGELFDIVVDATGSAAAMERSFDYVASGGAYVLVGVVKDRIGFSDPEFHRKELTLFASRNATRQDFDTVVSAMRAGKLPSAAMNTHSCRLDELPEALPRWAHDRVGVVKAMAHIGA